MQKLNFVTGNDIKFHLAEKICDTFDVSLEQVELDIPEIQSETGEPVARDKAQKAFDQLGTPLVVTDDSWVIPGLNGFPGPYMKSMNHWFTPEDWINLTAELEDREIILRQIAVYQDEHEQVLFAVDIKATLLKEVRGVSKFPHNTIISFDGGDHSFAELEVQGKTIDNHHTAWHELAAWLKARES
ncbi:MAG: non-canonical purine NTP pyrophosphatase [Candidatus Saccharibacteria bacterium]